MKFEKASIVHHEIEEKGTEPNDLEKLKKWERQIERTAIDG